jgi:hypothetical protein
MTIYEPHFNEEPRTRRPIVRSIRAFWCQYRKAITGFNFETGWSEGDSMLAPDRALYSNCDVLELERYRKAGGYELDKEKKYYDDHEIMYIVTFQIGSRMEERFYKPEHLFQILHDAYSESYLWDGEFTSLDFPPQPNYIKLETEEK